MTGGGRLAVYKLRVDNLTGERCHAGCFFDEHEWHKSNEFLARRSQMGRFAFGWNNIFQKLTNNLHLMDDSLNMMENPYNRACRYYSNTFKQLFSLQDE